MSFSKYNKVRGKFESLETRQLFAADLVGGAVVDAPATADSAPVATASDRCEATSFRLQLDGIANQMSLMQSFSYNGTTMRKNDTTVAGDQYQTDTCHVGEYGTISMTFKSDSAARDGIQQVKDQYEGSLAGTKPNGTVILRDRSSNDTVNWNINGWHIENFSVDQLMSQLGGQEGETLVDTIGSPTDGLIAIIALNGDTPEKHHVSPQEIDGEATDKDHKGFANVGGQSVQVSNQVPNVDDLVGFNPQPQPPGNDWVIVGNPSLQGQPGSDGFWVAPSPEVAAVVELSNQIDADSGDNINQLGDIKGEATDNDIVTAQNIKGSAIVRTQLEHGPGLHDSVHCLVGSNPTPHPMPVRGRFQEELRNQLEHGPGLHDSVHCLIGGATRTAQRAKGPDLAAHPRLVDQLMAENGCPNKADADVLPGKTNYLPWHRG